MTKKGITLANGNRLNHGQLFPRKDKTMGTQLEDLAMTQRRINQPAKAAPVAAAVAVAVAVEPKDPPNIARDGAEKKLTTPQPVFGHKRRTEGTLHPHLHGQAQDDAVPVKSYAGKSVPVHSAMTDNQKMSIDPIGNDAGTILRDAKNFGRK
jgi:hypothetical protein